MAFWGFFGGDQPQPASPRIASYGLIDGDDEPSMPPSIPVVPRITRYGLVDEGEDDYELVDEEDVDGEPPTPPPRLSRYGQTIQDDDFEFYDVEEDDEIQPQIPLSIPVQAPVDLNALFQGKCGDAGEWQNSVFCAMGEGSPAGNMLGSMRIVPGRDGYPSNSIAWKIYNLLAAAQKAIDANSLSGWIIQKAPWYRDYVRLLEQLRAAIEEGQPIMISMLDKQAEMLHTLMGVPLVRGYVTDYLRNTQNIALFDMPTIPVAQTSESWGDWLMRLLRLK